MRTETKRLAGIDLAWHSDNNPSALAFGELSDGVLEVTDVIPAVYSIEKIVGQLNSTDQLQGVAIDASLIIPNESGQRRCEKEIARHYGSRGAACHASNTTLYPDADSVKLSKTLSLQGFEHLGKDKWQIECYPHPAIIEIFGLERRLYYKKGRVADKKAGQKRLASLITGLSKNHLLPLRLNDHHGQYFDHDHINSLKGKTLKSNEDALDAIICLYIAGLYTVDAPSRFFGNIDDGYVWIPKGS